MRTFFLGWTAQYERRFISYLTTRYDVRRLEVPKLFKRMHRLATGFRKSQGVEDRLVPSLGRLYCCINGFKSSDVLVCNEGQVTRNVLPSIVRAFPGRKVLLVRDLVDESFVTRVTPFFDRIYSFDQAQCDQLGMHYLNQFLPLGFAEAANLNVGKPEVKVGKRCFFLGRDKGRSAVLDRLATVLQQQGCEVDFHIVEDSTSTPRSRFHTTELLDYEANLKLSLASDVLVEINQPGQSGFTLRTLEAAYFGKKLITNNVSVRNSPLFRANNIYVVDTQAEWDTSTLAAFLDAPYQPLPKETLYAYSPDHMIERVSAQTSH